MLFGDAAVIEWTSLAVVAGVIALLAIFILVALGLCDLDRRSRRLATGSVGSGAAREAVVAPTPRRRRAVVAGVPAPIDAGSS
ncbi:MAG TPA: hypothetical protein VFF67_00185 [Thermoplasmata archaeon]|nr:hypothetical protein [Thermoplasmata archaeon]